MALMTKTKINALPRWKPSMIDRGSGVRVRIDDRRPGGRNFRIRLPMGLCRIALYLTPFSYIKQIPSFVRKHDLMKLLAMVDREGLLVDVFDNDQTVQIRIGRITADHFKEATTMSEERMQVLKMLQEGKINAEEAEKLLNEIGAGEAVQGRTPVKSKMIRIRVFEGSLEKPKVRVSIPISLAKFAMNFVPNEQKARINDLNIDLDEIIRQVEEGAEGHLVDVEDVDDETGKPTKVEIWVD
jgi:hypothetical protein